MDPLVPAALGASHTDATSTVTLSAGKHARPTAIDKGGAPKNTGDDSAGAPGEEGDDHPEAAHIPGGYKRARARTMRDEPTTLTPDDGVSVRRSGRVRAPAKHISPGYTPKAARIPKSTKANPRPTAKSKKVDAESVSKDKAIAEPKPKAESDPKKPAAKDLWEPENARTRYSPFATRDLLKLLTPENINRQEFTDEEYDEIIALLPAEDIIYPANDDVTVPDGKPMINPELFNSVAFKEAVYKYQQDLAAGKHELGYLAKAAEARKRRMAGEFDNWKDEQFEVYWGQKQKLYSDAIAGASSKIKLAEMITASVFKLGDVFSMRRHFSGSLIIRKDATLIDMDKNAGTLNFSYPPGPAEWHKDDIADKTVENVMSLQALETLLCKESGKAPEKLPNGNAWKTIRVIRKGEDIGCVFDIRVKYHQQYYPDME